ncbi:MAG: zf-HC2 domain-containing protein [candidate division KSB1 bacterium]|nr:zf-HC2 domain-containing protein [candidate division KSB1 bacterium]MDZ7275923.1 zf-HC2 domain-containing protein [candidate division KSB1 bacterium]MDZ7285795.1 zf-HC2 domain-containing protein [candidate division KSB1 bacterium]MDZ7298827.1 zf-HC2 domain-containing protein [candidate division KSB1 bacterium]MDZ7308999.1 zf-HC2 domain-containing protein [candidate division KSB1 bacterium]
MQTSEAQTLHVEDATLWAWQRAELEGAPALAVQEHLTACPRCRERATQLQQWLAAMQAGHQSIHPTLAQQRQLIRALTQPAVPPSIWIPVSERLVRWLAPAVAVLAVLFLLMRGETSATSGMNLTEDVIEAPETVLFTATSDEQMQQAMLALMLRANEPQP